MSLLEDLAELQTNPELINKPFFKVKSDELKDWLVSTAAALIEEGKERTRVQRENLMLYRGVTFKREDKYRDRDRNQRKLSRVQKFIVNHLYDLTETKVSQMTRIKPAVEVLPTNDEWSDRASAKVVKHIQRHLWSQDDIDAMRVRMHRDARIFGESFMFILWNKFKGDLTPAYVRARDAGVAVDKKKYQDVKFTGDVDHQVEVPWRVYLQRAECYENSDYVFRISFAPKEELADDYPKADFESCSADIHIFDMEDLTEKPLEESVMVYEFWHKKTAKMPEGFYAKFTVSDILEKGDLPFNHGSLPIVRLTDLDVPGVMNGISRYETIASLQGMYNNLSTLIAKNIYLTAHAKWAVPRGSVKIEQLGNDNTILQYQGPVPPQLIQAAPNPAEVYAFRQQLREEMQIIYGSHGISRGDVPKGITAASALQFLNELETERATTDIIKDSHLIKNIAKMGIAVAGDFYDPEDGRLLRIVGENNKFLIRHFDTAHLHKSYDIRFDNSTGLPETKSAKMERILEAMQRNPSMVSGERWEHLLELADTEKMSTMMTEAVQAADSIVEDIMAGRPIQPLEEWHDLIPHWETYVKAMQGRGFNEEAGPEVRSVMKDHLFWTEEAMIEKMKGNPEFEAKLAQLVNFPIFKHSNFVAPRSLEQQMAMVQGQANRGDMVTGMIPGTSPQDMQEVAFAKEKMKRG